MLKPAIIELIEKGHDTGEIAEITGASRSYITTVRVEFNKITNWSRPALLNKPKVGTNARKIYDFIVANPDAYLNKVRKMTGLDYRQIIRVRKRYFKDSPWPKYQCL